MANKMARQWHSKNIATKGMLQP
ncbi:hypothetical protein CCACVL1_03453, partial [Corchorus capsularis]